MLIPLIENCLSNLPKNRPSIVRVCDQLEGQLVDRESNEFTVSELQQKDAELRRKDTEIQRKDFEIQRKDFEIQRKDFEIQRKAGEIQQKDTEIQMKVNQMQERDTEIQRNYREIQHLTATLHDKDVMLEALRLNMSKLQITDYHLLPKKVSKQCTIIACVMFQVNKSSSDFWNNLKLTWQQCADLPSKYFATSVAELDGKVYVTVTDSKFAHFKPLMYDSNKDQWSTLPALPYVNFTLVAVADRKQLLAIGGVVNNNGVMEISNKVFLWNEENRRWTTPYPNMSTGYYTMLLFQYIPWINSDSSWWSIMLGSMDYNKSSGSASY